MNHISLDSASAGNHAICFVKTGGDAYEEQRGRAVPLDGAEGTWAQRNATLETIRKVGRQSWQRESRYRRQGAVENLFFRYKRTLGNSLRACGYESQKREAMIGCNVLNRMAELGKPESQAIVGE